MLLTLYGACACVGQKPPVAPTAEVVYYPRDRFRLPNGLQVVVESAPDTGVAGVVLVVGSGAADEAPAKEGLAHLTEHLVFEARHENGATRWDRLTYQGGIEVNGGTSWDATNYSAFVPAPNLARVLELFAEVLTNPLMGVTPADFEHELSVVQNERRLRTENGTPAQALGWLSKQLFPREHPYARSVTGTQASLDALTLADAREFATRAYTPQNSTLAISAPRSVRVRALVEEAFARDAGAQAVRAPPTLDDEPPLPPPSELAKQEGLVASPTLWVGWSLPSSLATRAPFAPVLTPMASDTFASNVHSRDTSIGAVSAGYLIGARGDIVYLTATLDSAESAPSALESLVDELRRGFATRQGGNTLQRYKRLAAVRSTYGEEFVTTRTFNLAFSEHFQQDPSFISRRDSAILDIEPADIAAYLDKYLTAERARAVLVQPGDDRSLRTILRKPLEDDSAGARRAAIDVLGASELARWMQPFRASHASTSKLSNGLRLAVLRVPEAVFHTVLLGFLGGTAAAEVPGVSVAERWAVSQSNWEQSLQGLHHNQPVDPDASMEVVRSTGFDVSLTLKALRQELKPAEIFWPPREFLRRLDSYRREDDGAPQRLRRAEWRALLGDHPYGYYASAAAIRAVRPAQISRWRDLTRRPENALLVVVGDVNPDAVEAAAEAELADWRPPSQPPVAVPPPPALAASPPGFLFQDWPRSTLPRISLACALPVELKDKYTFRLVANVIGNHIRGWLRGQLGASYSTSFWVQWLRGGSAILRVAADVSYEKLPLALAEFQRFTATDAPYNFTPAQVDSARQIFASSYNVQLDGTSSIAFRIFEQWKLGAPIEELDSVPQRVFSASLTDINALGQRCQSHAVLSVLGDSSRIEPGLLARATSPSLPN